MFKDLSFSAFTMGLLTAFAGFASSFSVVLEGFRSVGASPEQAASGLMMAAVAMGLGAIILSLPTKLPVSLAWSTPGAALLVTTGVVEGGFAVAVGAFIMCAVAIIISGVIKPLGEAVSKIPKPIASAMLAGILFGLCLAPFKAIAFDPVLGLPIFLAWAVFRVIRPLMAVPAALFVFVLVIVFGTDVTGAAIMQSFSGVALVPVFVMPEFTLAGAISIALPLYIVTMASQNIPGIVVITSYGYASRAREWFTVTGILSLLAAPFGSHAINLAAITAAMCAGEEAHPDRAKRYWAAVIAGIFYTVFGLLAGYVTAFVNLAPTILLQAVAGLALISAFLGAVVSAVEDRDMLEPAIITFLVTASGVTIVGISGAFWGLVAGCMVLGLRRWIFAR